MRWCPSCESRPRFQHQPPRHDIAVTTISPWMWSDCFSEPIDPLWWCHIKVFRSRWVCFCLLPNVKAGWYFSAIRKLAVNGSRDSSEAQRGFWPRSVGPSAPSATLLPTSPPDVCPCAAAKYLETRSVPGPGCCDRVHHPVSSEIFQTRASTICSLLKSTVLNMTCVSEEEKLTRPPADHE